MLQYLCLCFFFPIKCWTDCVWKPFYVNLNFRLKSWKTSDTKSAQSNITISNFYFFFGCCFFPVYFFYIFAYDVHVGYWYRLRSNSSMCALTFGIWKVCWPMARVSSLLISIVFNARVFERAKYFNHQLLCTKPPNAVTRNEWKN